jgi:hypothetical protein
MNLLNDKTPPPEWVKHAGDKICEVLVEELEFDEACALLVCLLHAFQTNCFSNGDRHRAALDLAALYTELADELDARGRRLMQEQQQ